MWELHKKSLYGFNLKIAISTLLTIVENVKAFYNTVITFDKEKKSFIFLSNNIILFLLKCTLVTIDG